MSYNGFTDWMLRNRRTGKTTIAQAPNLAAWISFALVVAVWMFPDSPRALALTRLAVLAATWWGVDELVRGENPLRRSFGAATLALLVFTFARSSR